MLALSAPALAADAPLAGDEVLVSAQSVERNTAERLVVAEGAVVIRHKEMRMEADRIVYHEESHFVVADGNVVLDSAGDRLQGDHMELNLDTRVGFLDNAQGFVQTYYLTGKRIEKLGPDRYFIRSGTFTTCEGVLPDWSFHSTSTTVTVDEYIHAWNPNLRVKRLPLLYVPYAIFPIKRDRSTGLLIPELTYSDRDGFVVRNAFYWAPRDNFDATIGIEYLQETGWGASGEMRYLLAPRTQGTVEAYYLRSDALATGLGERWSLSTRNSHELPLGVHLEAEAFFQSDRLFTATYGDTIEERSNERTSSSFYLNRSWSAWDFALSGRLEESLLTERSTTLTRFPELTIDRTSHRLFDSDVYLKVNASGARLRRESGDVQVETTRLHVDPEVTWPIPLGTVARILPSASYALTWYDQGIDGQEETRGIPTWRLSLEGPRPYRIWDLGGERVERLKHLVEPRVSYVYTPTVDQANLPQFDSIDSIEPANRLEYSITNTLYAKMREKQPAKKAGDRKKKAAANAAPDAAAAEAAAAPATPTTPTTPAAPAAPAEAAPPETPAAAETPGAAGAETPAAPETAAAAVPETPAAAAPETPAGAGEETPAVPTTTTQELLWIKLSQSYEFSDEKLDVVTTEGLSSAEEPFSAIGWEVRSRPPGAGIELSWRGDFDVYGRGIGFQNLSITWNPWSAATLRGEWRTSRDSNQDFLDVGGDVTLGRFTLEGRSRYSLADETFVENRVSVKYTSQCWDVTLGYVNWVDTYEYSLLLSLKGIGTIVKI